MKEKFTTAQLNGFWSNPANWKAGAIYRCKEDPRVIVPKRNKWSGWTINFGHPFAWPVLILIIVCMSGPLFLLALKGWVNTPLWYVVLIADVTTVCLVCWYFASPKRYG